MRIGILPQFNLILNVGLRLVIPESMDINDQTVALEFSSDIELRVESSEFVEEINLDLLSVEMKNATVCKDGVAQLPR